MEKAEDDLASINIEEPVRFEQPIEPEKRDTVPIRPKSNHKVLASILFAVTMLLSMALGALIVWYFIFDSKPIF